MINYYNQKRGRTMTTLEFISAINGLRKDNKNKWVNITYDVNGYKVGIKSFGTWIQKLDIKKDNVILCTFETQPNCKISGFIDCLVDAMKEVE